MIMELGINTKWALSVAVSLELEQGIHQASELPARVSPAYSWHLSLAQLLIRLLLMPGSFSVSLPLRKPSCLVLFSGSLLLGQYVMNTLCNQQYVKRAGKQGKETAGTASCLVGLVYWNLFDLTFWGQKLWRQFRNWSWKIMKTDSTLP